MDVWADFRIFEFNKIDKTYERPPLSYRGIEDRYNLIVFNEGASCSARESDAPSDRWVSPVNFLEELYLKENNASLHPENRIESLKRSDYKDCFIFKKPPAPKEKEKLKELLQDKIIANQYLINKYSEVKRKEKNIKVLPVSLCLYDDELLSIFPDLHHTGDWITGDISGVIKLLRKKVTFLLNRLKHRSVYSRFLGYTQVLLLNNIGLPYVQINFFVTGEDLTSFYPDDINNAWHDIAGNYGFAEFYIFRYEDFAPGKINYIDGRECFPGEGYIFSRGRNISNRMLERHSTGKPSRKRIMSVDDIYKKFFFLVSCRYTKIPGQRTMSSSAFTYSPTQKNSGKKF
ncbi:hypothetical protein [Buttiauxella gaviniae]|uniref:hypothetical protein n=1 Tax=Buttiauxella gaviniae TaxID=82990 RepID=UPI003C7154B7